MVVQPLQSSFLLRPSNHYPQHVHLVFTNREPPVRRLYTSSSSSSSFEDPKVVEEEGAENATPCSATSSSNGSSPDTAGAVKQRPHVTPARKRDENNASESNKKPLQQQQQPQPRIAPRPPFTTSQVAAVTAAATAAGATSRPRTTILPWNKAIRDISRPNWMLDSLREQHYQHSSQHQRQRQPPPLRNESKTDAEEEKEPDTAAAADFEPPSDPHYWKKRCFYWQEICQTSRKRLRDLEEDSRQLRRRIWQLEEQVVWTANQKTSASTSSRTNPATTHTVNDEEGAVDRLGEDNLPEDALPTTTNPISPNSKEPSGEQPPTVIVTLPKPRHCSFYLTDGEGLSDSEGYLDDDEYMDDEEDDGDECCHHHHHHHDKDEDCCHKASNKKEADTQPAPVPAAKATKEAKNGKEDSKVVEDENEKAVDEPAVEGQVERRDDDGPKVLQEEKVDDVVFAETKQQRQVEEEDVQETDAGAVPQGTEKSDAKTMEAVANENTSDKKACEELSKEAEAVAADKIDR